MMAKEAASSGKDAPAGSLADAYGAYAASMSAAGVSGLDGRGTGEGKASGGKSLGGGAPSASAPSSAGRGGTSVADVGKGNVSVGAKGEGLSVNRGLVPDGVSLPSVMAPSARQAQEASMTALRGGLMPTTARAAETMSMNRHTALQNALGTIRVAEAGRIDPYNRLVDAARGRNAPTHTNLTQMTVADVMAFQRGMRASGHKSSAVGAYQFMQGTLPVAARLAGIDPETTKFSPAVQDQLAIAMLDERARQAEREGAIDPTTFADRIANEWAALQQSTGRGAYDGDGLNHASVPHSTVLGLAGDLIDSGAVQPSNRATTGPSITLPDVGPIPASRPADLPETMPAPSPRPGFGQFTTAFGPSPRSMEGPGGIYLDAPPPQQAGMTVPPMGFSGGLSPRGQEQAAPPAAAVSEAFPGRSRGPGGPLSLAELADADAARGFIQPENRPAMPAEQQPERRTEVDPEREARRERNADRIDKVLPWVAGPVAGKINEARREAGKTTAGQWLVDLFGDSQGGAPIIVERGGGEGVADIVQTPVAPQPAYQPGSWLYGIFEEPTRPTPREKWSR
jgi:muramidase (phage lysozyme)